jgi:hypothetical protein
VEVHDPILRRRRVVAQGVVLRPIGVEVVEVPQRRWALELELRIWVVEGHLLGQNGLPWVGPLGDGQGVVEVHGG